MHTGFEILPFSAEWLEAEGWSGETEQGERAMRMARGGRGGRPARAAPGSAGKAGLGAMAKGGRAAGAGKGLAPGAKPPAGKSWSKGKGMPVGRYPRRRPVGWPGPWGGVWPAGVAVYEPDWLAVADAPPGDEPDGAADDDSDDMDYRSDAGEW